MSKLLKLLLGTTLLVVVLAAISVVVALLYFDPNEHKDFFISRVEETTGRTFAISGPIQMTWYPWFGFQAEGITLGNAQGFGEAPFLQADRIALRIKTLPLLNKHYELDKFQLYGLRLNLARHEDGTTNWADLSAAKEPAGTAQEPLPLAAVVLGGVDIQDGQINWQDAGSGQTVLVSGLTVATGELTYGAPINLAVAFKADANQPALNADVKMNGVLNYDLDSEIYALKPIDLVAKLTGKEIPGGATDLIFKAAVESNLKEDTASINDLSLEVLGTSVKGTLSAAKVSSGTPEIKAQLSIMGDDLAKLFQLVDSKAAGELDRLDDRSVDIKLNLSADLGQENLQISDLNAKLLGAVIQGQVEASHIRSKTPSAKGNLKATGPDLPALLQVVGQFETGEKPKLRDYGKRLAKVAEKSFDIAAEFDADLSSGNIQIPTLSAKTLGFTLQGQLAAQAINSTSGKVDGKFTLHGEKLAEVLSAMDQKALGEVLQVFDINAGVSGAGGNINLIPLVAKATFAGKQIPNSPAEVALNADTKINLEKQTLAMNNMTLQGLGLNMTGDINAANILSGSPAVTGKVDARGADLALLFKVAGVEPLAGQLAALDNRSFDIKAGLDADLAQGKLKLSNLDAKLLGATITGQVDASHIQSKTPSARGKLQATGPDLPALLQVIGQFETGKDPKLRRTGEQLARATQKSFDIAAEFDADLKAGNIRIPTLTAKTLGINLNGQLDAQGMNTNSGKVNGKLSLQGEKLADVLAVFGQGGLGEVMQSIAIDAGISGSGGDIALSPLQARATFAGKQIPNSPVAMTMNANTRVNLGKQTLVIDNLAVDGLGLNVKANVSATQILDKPGFSGDLSVAEFNLRQLAQQLNQTLPETADKNVFNKVALKTGIEGSSDSLNLKDLVVQLDETKVNGSLSVEKFSQPDIKFGVVIDSINADRYLPPAAKGKPVTPESAAGAAASELPLDTLRALRMSGDLQAGQLVISNAKLSNVKLTLKARDGDIRLEPVTADLYQGKYQGSVALNAKGKLPMILVNTQLSSVNLEPLMKDYMQQPQSPLAGIADISLSPLNGTGANAAQIKHSLTGKGKILVKDGILRGVDVNKTLEQVEIMIESKIPAKLESGGETPFKQLTATLEINNGVVTNKDMLLVAPGFKATGKGMLANLNDETIKYDMKVAVDETQTARGENRYNIGGYELPVQCRGKLSAPVCQPDAGDIAKVLLKKTGEEKIKELLKDKLGIETAPAPAGTAATQPKPVQQTTTKPSSTTTTTAPKKKKKDVTEELLKEAVEGLFD